MAKYDASGDKIQRRVPVFSIVLLIAGIIILVAGIIYYSNSDMSKYYKGIDISESYDANGIKDIEIDFGAGEMVIAASQDEYIHVEGKNIPEDYTFKINGNEFEVGLHKDWKVWNTNWFNFNFGDDNSWNNITELKIYLPQKDYEEISIDNGAGDMTISDISYAELSIDIGAGEVTATNLNCWKEGGETSFDLGAGEAIVSKSRIKNLEADIGAGEFEFQGDISGDIDVDAGVGECRFILDGSEDSYRFLDYGKNKYGSNSGKYDVRVDHGVGEVNFKFDGKVR